MYVKGRMLTNHLKANVSIYLFMTTLLITGIVFGAIIVNSMSFIQKQDLFFHMNQFFKRIYEGEQIISKDIFQKSISFHIQYLILLFLLGLTIIGMPFIWLLIFIKGLVIGFSVGFIVNQLGLKGLLFATVSIAPQNVIIIPVYIIAATLANLFSLFLLQKILSRTNSEPIFRPFLQYISTYSILIIIALFGSIVETFIAYEAVKISVNSFY